MLPHGNLGIWIGFDPREAAGFMAAKRSIRRFTSAIPVVALDLRELQEAGLYKRPLSRAGGNLYDPISDAPMSTEFAISRFFVPHLAGGGWALFCDGDVLFRRNPANLFALADDRFAVQVVKHRHNPRALSKMDGQRQTQYRRKNWSSVMLINCDHPAHAALTLDLLNSAPGRDLHAFCWLKDSEVGDLPVEWNWLVGESEPVDNPALVHFTNGLPFMTGYEDAPFGGEWWRALGEAIE